MFGSCSFHKTVRSLERASPLRPSKRRPKGPSKPSRRFARLRLVRRKRRRRVPVLWAEWWLVFAAIAFGVLAWATVLSIYSRW